jgi:hypothetical protein
VLTDENDAIEERLARLRRATDGVRPSTGFEARVLGALEAEPANARPSAFPAGLWPAARRCLPLAALAAALALVWALESESAADDALATTYDATELAW